jgi:hypothetical protein
MKQLSERLNERLICTCHIGKDVVTDTTPEIMIVYHKWIKGEIKKTNLYP